MAGMNGRDGRPYRFSLVNALSKFRALDPRIRIEKAEEMRRVLLPAIDLWISIRDTSIMTLQHLAREADKCQENYGDGAELIDTAVMGIEGYGLVGRIFSFVSPGGHAFLRCMSTLGSLISSGVKTGETVEVNRIMNRALKAVENDSIESESLDKWIDRYIEIDRTAETEAVEALLYSVHKEVGNPKFLRYLNCNYEKFIAGTITSIQMLRVCMQILHELKDSNAVDSSTKNEISQFFRDARRNPGVKSLWVSTFFHVFSECVADYFIEPNLDTGCTGVAVQTFVLLKKMIMFKKWACRPKTSDEIKGKIADMEEEKKRILEYRDFVQKSCDNE